MDHKNITHNLNAISEEQKSDLKLAETLLENINSLRDSAGYPKTVLYFGGEEFSSNNAGFFSGYVTKDINLAITRDLESHLNFIIRNAKEKFRILDAGKKSKTDLKNLEHHFTILFKYYGIDSNITYPLYNTQEDFKNALLELKSSVNNDLRK
jgi:hypothetical protein